MIVPVLKRRLSLAKGNRRRQKSLSQKKKYLSRKNDKEIENIEEEIGRQSHELIKECKHVLAQEETLQANLDVCNERLEELDRSRRFAWGFTRSIGCGGNELGHTCALDNKMDFISFSNRYFNMCVQKCRWK